MKDGEGNCMGSFSIVCLFRMVSCQPPSNMYFEGMVDGVVESGVLAAEKCSCTGFT